MRVYWCFCARAGIISQENYFFTPPFIGTNWFRPHSFVPTPGITIPPQPYLGTQTCFAAYRGKVRALLFFSTIQTKHNSQSTTYCYLALRGALECDLSWIVLPWGRTLAPLKDLSLLTKFALVQQVVRTCFCDCLTKHITRATRTNHKTTASLFSWIVW